MEESENRLRRRQKREIRLKCHTTEKVEEGSDGKEARVLKNHRHVTFLKVCVSRTCVLLSRPLPANDSWTVRPVAVPLG
ncbi:hypothetical protein Tco_1106359 [Tanacetum coccineum]